MNKENRKIGQSQLYAWYAGEDRYQAFKRMLFLNFWIVGGITACLYILMDDFIILWLRKSLLLDPLTVTLLCVMFFMQQTRAVPGAYMTATGLFVRDRARPVIEAALNLGISILALHWLGVAGIFVGTIVSCLLTVFWRVPWLLYHHSFHKSTRDYWLLYAEYALLTLAAAFLTSRIKAALPFAGPSLLVWILNGCICAVVYAALHFLLFCIDYPWNPPLVRYNIGAIRDIAKGMKVGEQKILNIEPLMFSKEKYGEITIVEDNCKTIFQIPEDGSAREY